MDRPTSIRIYTSTWKRLNNLKELGMSMDDVINKLLEAAHHE